MSSTTVTGPVYLPDGTAPQNGSITFELTSWDRELNEATFVTGPYVATIDGNTGNFTVTLFSNTNGVNNAIYRVTITYSDIYGNYHKNCLGTVSLTGSGPFKLSNLNFVDPSTTGSFNLYSDIQAIETNVTAIQSDIDNTIAQFNARLTVLSGAVGDGVTNDTGAFVTALQNNPGIPIFVPKGTYLVDDGTDLSNFYGEGKIIGTPSGDNLREPFFTDYLGINDENGGPSTLPKAMSKASLAELRLHEDSDKKQLLNLLFRPDPNSTNKYNSIVLHLYGHNALGPQIDIVGNQPGLTLKQSRNPNIAPELGTNYVGTGGALLMTRAGDGTDPNPSASSPISAQTRTMCSYKHEGIIFDGKTAYGAYAGEWSGIQNGIQGNGQFSYIWGRDKELEIKVTGADNLYLNARAQVRVTSGLALGGQDITVTPACTVSSFYRDINTNRPVWYNTTLGTYEPVVSDKPMGIIAASPSLSVAYTGNNYYADTFTSVSRNDFGSSFFVNGVFTVPAGKGGWYNVTGSVNWSGFLPLESVSIAVNGTRKDLRGMQQTPSATWQVYLNEGDTLQLVGYNANGGSNTVTSCYLELVRYGNQ